MNSIVELVKSYGDYWWAYAGKAHIKNVPVSFEFTECLAIEIRERVKNEGGRDYLHMLAVEESLTHRENPAIS